MRSRTDFQPEASGRSDAVAVDPRVTQHRRHFLNGSYSLRPVSPESVKTWEFLSPISPNQPDFGDCGLGRKRTLLAIDLMTLCGIVTTSFDAPVDVTGAVSNCMGNYSVRSHRNRIWRQAAVSGLLDRRFDRWYKSDS